jgi:hypothetical protein
MSEWEEGRIEVSVVNAANLPRLHVGSMHAIQVVDRETCTALVLPGASQDEAERLLRMIVDGNPGGEVTSQNPTTDKATTSQTGHCEVHCHPDCRGGEVVHYSAPEPFIEQHISRDLQTYWGVRCPYCYGAEQSARGCDALVRAAVAEEREHIVAWIRTSIGDEADTGELADDIERGAHMEANRG